MQVYSSLSEHYVSVDAGTDMRGQNHCVARFITKGQGADKETERK